MPDTTSTDESALRLFTVLTEIGIIAQLANKAAERALADDMSMAQFSVLNHFSRRPEPENPSHLAAAFQVTKGAMTQTLQKLDAAGYVRIEADPKDGRAKQVVMTSAGAMAHKKAVSALAPLMVEAASGLNMKDIVALLPGLQALRMRLDEARNPVDFPEAKTPVNA